MAGVVERLDRLDLLLGPDAVGPQLSRSSSSSAGRPPPPPVAPPVARDPAASPGSPAGWERLRLRISFWALMSWARSFLGAFPRPLEGLLLPLRPALPRTQQQLPLALRRLGALSSVLGGTTAAGGEMGRTLRFAGPGRGGEEGAGRSFSSLTSRKTLESGADFFSARSLGGRHGGRFLLRHFWRAAVRPV